MIQIVKMLITSDGGYRGAKTIDLKSIVDAALLECDGIESVFSRQTYSF